MNVQQLVGLRIREIRELNELTQEQLGAQLEPLLGKGWPRQAVSSAEQGGRAFTAAELVAVAHTLGVSVARLFAAPMAVREVEMPSGARLDRQALVNATFAPVTVDKGVAQALESLRILMQALSDLSHHREALAVSEAVAFRSVEVLLQNLENISLVADLRGGSDGS